MYLYLYMYCHVSVPVYVLPCIYTCICTAMYPYLYMYCHVSVPVYVLPCIYTCICTATYLYLYMYCLVSIPVYVLPCIRTCICTALYLYLYVLNYFQLENGSEIHKQHCYIEKFFFKLIFIRWSNFSLSGFHVTDVSPHKIQKIKIEIRVVILSNDSHHSDNFV
jgi:hypothetical protein